MAKIDIDELLAILPQLIRENDTVKGAILTALSGVVATHEDVKELIREMDKRFEAADAKNEVRFNKIETRLDGVDKRFDGVDKRLNNIDTSLLKVKASVDNLGERSGKALEETILKLMQEQLLNERIEYTEITRESLTDEKGEIFFPGYTTDVDIVAQNGTISLFEIKYKADQRDIFHFYKNAQLYERQTRKKPTHLYIVCLEISEKTLIAVKNWPVKVIAGKIEIIESITWK